MARNTQPPEGEPVVPETQTADGAPPLAERTVPELEAEAAARGIAVEGSGKDGNVVKADLVEALDLTPEKVAELKAERDAARADAEAASERANAIDRQLAAAAPDELQAAGLPPLIQVAEASAAALNPTPVED